jgi:arylsulfatase A-like enzyme
MRAIVLMFDTLCRRLLEPYGSTEGITPNFSRLAARSTRFDNCYAGSMPCMPARREMHTGRYNFLHRSWGPLEPFDDSVPEMLKHAGVYTHLVTDHYHYWEDGGLTYHNRFSSYEFFRGQEGDPWKGHVTPVDHPRTLNADNARTRSNWVNRLHQPDEASHSQTLTVDAGLEFLATNADDDKWMLQIECFDPHEPFYSTDEYLALFETEYEGTHFDWPVPKRVVESLTESQHVRNEYLALLAMCDHSLGRVLDFMDEHSMWDDTMLLLCTDHGFLLGEHQWWGKSVQPWYDENIHTPLFVWDPRHPDAPKVSDELVQTIDIGPTLLEFFGLPLTSDMQGEPLGPVLANEVPIARRGALFGSAGGHANVTDGRYVYMRNAVSPANEPFFDYTLMPTHMHHPMTPEELHDAELAPPFPFTKGAPVLKVRGWTRHSPYPFGTMLFDLEQDPQQENPIQDAEIELRMTRLLVDLMRETDAPVDQYERLGLPASGAVTEDHLLIEKQWHLVQAASVSPPTRRDFPPGAIVTTSTVHELMQHQEARELIVSALPRLRSPWAQQMHMNLAVIDIAAMDPLVDLPQLQELDRQLSALTRP